MFRKTIGDDEGSDKMEQAWKKRCNELLTAKYREKAYFL
jgi:hypothetical protein